MLFASSNIASFNTYYLSERAVTVEFGNEISETLQQISRFNQLLQQQPFDGFSAAVPAYTSLTVFYDPLQVAASAIPGADSFEKVVNYLNQLHSEPGEIKTQEATTVTIPVCYGGNFGQDLEYVAALHSLTPNEVIDLHCSTVYKVYMIGFVPGFAYLGGMDELLASPRKTTPRKAIPAGSVGIAGQQTGVYPLKTPGGWQLIGRTPLTLFNPTLSQPSLLKAGDEVVFKPIAHHEFELYQNHADPHH
jgi:inhibitor of KinA